MRRREQGEERRRRYGEDRRRGGRDERTRGEEGRRRWYGMSGMVVYGSGDRGWSWLSNSHTRRLWSMRYGVKGIHMGDGYGRWIWEMDMM